ncbi:MAG: hypothetical protein ACYC2Y_03700 [Armatimonadota bacterium]
MSVTQQIWKAVRQLSPGKAARDVRRDFAHAPPEEAARAIVRNISRENAVFVIGTALGSVLPTPLLPLIGIAEAASDTTFITANQVRMLFMVGAVYGTRVGYAAQWREIASIVGAAFGWRSIARALVAGIPFGGGLLPKGAVAYAGTMAVGESLIFYYTTGRHMTKSEIKEAFRKSYTESLDAVRSLVRKFRSS